MSHAGGPAVLERPPVEAPGADPGVAAASENQSPGGRTEEQPLAAPAPPPVPGATLEAIERHAILKTLQMVGGSTGRAAAILKISPRTIQYKLKRYRAEGIAVPAPCAARRPRPEE